LGLCLWHTGHKQAEAILGDLEEPFARDCTKFGGHRAKLFYWASVAKSFIPMLFRYLKHVRAIALFEAARKLFLG